MLTFEIIQMCYTPFIFDIPTVSFWWQDQTCENKLSFYNSYTFQWIKSAKPWGPVHTDHGSTTIHYTPNGYIVIAKTICHENHKHVLRKQKG